MNGDAVRWSIRDAIQFYEYRGWNWLNVVDYFIWGYNNAAGPDGDRGILSQP